MLEYNELKEEFELLSDIEDYEGLEELEAYLSSEVDKLMMISDNKTISTLDDVFDDMDMVELAKNLKGLKTIVSSELARLEQS